MGMGVGMEYWLKVLVGILGVGGVSTMSSYNTAIGGKIAVGKKSSV